MIYSNKLTINILPEQYVVAQMAPDSKTPTPPDGQDLFAVIRAVDEVTLICLNHLVPKGAKVEPGWRVLKVIGPLDFSLVGILAQLAGVLAEAGISIFALSTFNTDYLLVKAEDLADAEAALTGAGHQIAGGNHYQNEC